MKKIFLLSLFAVYCFSIAGCGYTTSSALPGHLKTIFVEPFPNNIDYATERTRNIYIPLLEIKVRNAIIDRFLFDGNLRIVEEDVADMILQGELIGYDRVPLRFTDEDAPEEFRVEIVVNLTLIDTKYNKVIWQENSFVGDSDFFRVGTEAVPENVAVEKARLDLARRVVERTIENW